MGKGFKKKEPGREEGFVFAPLTSDRWSDFERLFGQKGACGGCWCMWWRLRRKDFEKQRGDGNREAMKKIVESEEVPGVLAYIGEIPVGWCSVASRERYVLLENSRILKPVDDKPVWSIVCFFVDKEYRKKGLTLRLLQAAVEYASENGAEIVEAYPVEPKKERYPDVFAYTGFASTFIKFGFKEVLRRSETRPIMRYYLADSNGKVK